MKAKILVVLPTSNFLHRQILEGILEYAKSNGPWQFHLVTGDDFEQGLQATERWGATGFIALVRETAQMKRLFDRRLPGIFLNPPAPLGGRGKAKPPRRTVFVNRDQEGVGQTAADYFLERGYTSFASSAAPVRPHGPAVGWTVSASASNRRAGRCPCTTIRPLPSRRTSPGTPPE